MGEGREEWRRECGRQSAVGKTDRGRGAANNCNVDWMREGGEWEL